ncbi:hypothetical protein [uncultured Paracoccus sp.]|nr:hypothetical protein [uncultured Paracoccus sp.]
MAPLFLPPVCAEVFRDAFAGALPDVVFHVGRVRSIRGGERRL